VDILTCYQHGVSEQLWG